MDFASDASLFLGSTEDFPQIYEDMKKQFPSCEMYTFKTFVQLLNNNKYKILLYRRNTDNVLVGYALVYIIENSNVLWLDYIAVLTEYSSHGYGSSLFKALWQKYCGPFDGIMFSVEHVCNNDPKLAERQKRRLNFYERLGAHRLNADFLLPCDDGSFPMYLYYKPRRDCASVSRSVQIQSITQMYDYCFFNLKHRKELLPLYKNTILDEKFVN